MPEDITPNTGPDEPVIGPTAASDAAAPQAPVVEPVASVISETPAPSREAEAYPMRGAEDYTAADPRILEYVEGKNGEPFKAPEIVEKLGIPLSEVFDHMDQMREGNIVEYGKESGTFVETRKNFDARTQQAPVVEPAASVVPETPAASSEAEVAPTTIPPNYNQLVRFVESFGKKGTFTVVDVADKAAELGFEGTAVMGVLKKLEEEKIIQANPHLDSKEPTTYSANLEGIAAHKQRQHDAIARSLDSNFEPVAPVNTSADNSPNHAPSAKNDLNATPGTSDPDMRKWYSGAVPEKSESTMEDGEEPPSPEPEVGTAAAANSGNGASSANNGAQTANAQAGNAQAANSAQTPNTPPPTAEEGNRNQQGPAEPEEDETVRQANNGINQPQTQPPQTPEGNRGRQVPSHWMHADDYNTWFGPWIANAGGVVREHDANRLHVQTYGGSSTGVVKIEGDKIALSSGPFGTHRHGHASHRIAMAAAVAKGWKVVKLRSLDKDYLIMASAHAKAAGLGYKRSMLGAGMFWSAADDKKVEALANSLAGMYADVPRPNGNDVSVPRSSEGGTMRRAAAAAATAAAAAGPSG